MDIGPSFTPNLSTSFHELYLLKEAKKWFFPLFRPIEPKEFGIFFHLFLVFDLKKKTKVSFLNENWHFRLSNIKFYYYFFFQKELSILPNFLSFVPKTSHFIFLWFCDPHIKTNFLSVLGGYVGQIGASSFILFTICVFGHNQTLSISIIHNP